MIRCGNRRPYNATTKVSTFLYMWVLDMTSHSMWRNSPSIMPIDRVLLPIVYVYFLHTTQHQLQKATTCVQLGRNTKKGLCRDWSHAKMYFLVVHLSICDVPKWFIRLKTIDQLLYRWRKIARVHCNNKTVEFASVINNLTTYRAHWHEFHLLTM